MSKPAPTDLVPPQWKRNPVALWVYIAAGVGMILLSGGRIVLERIGLRRCYLPAPDQARDPRPRIVFLKCCPPNRAKETHEPQACPRAIR
jgi:hypothetical protein